MLLVGLDGCEVRLCDRCARVRPCVPCVSRVNVNMTDATPVCVPAPPASFYRFTGTVLKLLNSNTVYSSDVPYCTVPEAPIFVRSVQIGTRA